MEDSGVDLPETRYALSGDVSIAYQVHGEGPIDLVVVPAWITNVEHMWEESVFAAYYRRIGETARVIRFDKRGTGLSDRVAGIADMETRMDDVRAVMDAVGSERAAVMGLSEGGPLAALFAATYPERTLGLILWGSAPRFSRAPGFPWGSTREEYLAEVEDLVRRWGTTELALEETEPVRPEHDGRRTRDPRVPRIARIRRRPTSRARECACDGSVRGHRRLDREGRGAR